MEFITLNPELQKAFSPLLPGEIAHDLVTQPDIVAMGAVEDHTPAGVLVFAMEETQLRILWLCTAEEMQGRGIARALLRLLVERALTDRDAMRLVADVPASSPLNPAFTLFLGEGWIPTPFRLKSYTCTLAQLAEQEFWKQELSEKGAVPLSTLPHFMLKEYSFALETQGAPVQLPLQLGEYDPDLSLGYVSGNMLRACVLVSSDEGGLTLSFAHAQPEAKVGIAMLFHSVGKRAIAKYPPETRFSFAAITPASRQLAEKLLPLCEMQPMYRMIRPLPPYIEERGN